MELEHNFYASVFFAFLLLFMQRAGEGGEKAGDGD
jgi:hypothetical protein